MSPAPKSLSQSHLEYQIKQLFTETNILTNVRKQTSVRSPTTTAALELDLYLPEFSLALEFQDAYHYETMWYSQAPLAEIQEKDNVKGSLTTKQGITLIQIPYWWDSTPESLVATVQFNRPDLLSQYQSTASPIPLNPPSLNSVYSIPDVGELMLASIATSSSQLALSISPETAWWMGEKYDGIRFVWNSNSKKIYTRRGQELVLFKDDSTLNGKAPFYDGEIWSGRGMFMEVQKIVSAAVVPWEFFRGIVFDDASPHLFSLPFEKRYERLLNYLSRTHAFFIIAMRTLCDSTYKLRKMMKSVIEDGGEGVMLRIPGSKYQPGRSYSLVKVKSARADAEALVVAISNYEMTLKLPNGNTFEIPLEEVDVDIKLKEGDIVTYEYDQFSRREIPVNPCITRVRYDISWKDILLDFKNSTPQPNLLSRVSEGIFEFTSKPQGYWTAQEGKNLRKLFEDFARQRNLDPLSADTWYSIGRYMLEDEKGAQTAFTLKGGYVKALKSIFAELEFDESKFAFLNQGYWRNVTNRKQFFISFAEENNFDPLVPENWYSVARQDLLLRKGHKSILERYNGNVGKALVHLFPDVKFDLDKFGVPHGYWGDGNNRKQFFDKYAEANNFDPLVPQNWYRITREELIKSKNAIAVLKYHNDSFANALLDTYPNIGLNTSKFANPPRGLWTEKQNRKAFFDTFARENQFDPLIASNWYKVSPQKFKSRKGSASVLAYYKGNFVEALLDLYVGIQLDKDQFPIIPNRDWANSDNRREFFTAFAQDYGFDPLIASNWRNITEAKLKSRKFADSVLRYYGGSYQLALSKLFPDIGINFESKVA